MERRYLDTTVRAAEDMVIRGTASVFYDGSDGTEYNLFDNAFERIHVSAWDSILRSKHDVLGLFNHDINQILGRTPETLKVWSDAEGLQYEIKLPDTTLGRDLYKLVQRGDIRGSSFGATIGYSSWSKQGDKDVRTIQRFKSLRDVSPVAIPAYSGTRVSLRSSDIKELCQERDLSLQIEAIKSRIKK